MYWPFGAELVLPLATLLALLLFELSLLLTICWYVVCCWCFCWKKIIIPSFKWLPSCHMPIDQIHVCNWKRKLIRQKWNEKCTCCWFCWAKTWRTSTGDGWRWMNVVFFWKPIRGPFVVYSQEKLGKLEICSKDWKLMLFNFVERKKKTTEKLPWI